MSEAHDVTSDDNEVLYDVSDHIATITLNAPERMNTISGPMLNALSARLIEANEDPEVRVVILTGNGRAFCAGLDVKAQTQGKGLSIGSAGFSSLDMRNTPPIVLQAMDKPTICAVNGGAAGYGLDMALGCDIRLMADTAKLAAAFTKRGVVPESGGTWILPRLLGWSKAAELIFTGRTLNAEEAVEWGLASEVVPAEQLMDRARTLAQDVESVALPIIRFSEVLSEADLLEIIASGQTNKQITIAQRDHLSTTLTDALIDTDHQVVVQTVVENTSADISEQGFQKVIAKHAEDGNIQALLVARPKLPAKIVERLIGLVSDELKQNLITRHQLPPEMAGELARMGQERSLVRMLLRDSRVGAIEELVDRLRAKGNLTPTLMLRALCEGDVHFFEVALARVANISPEKTKALLGDKGDLGLHTLYRRADMPELLFAAFRVVVNIVYDPKNSATEREEVTRLIVNGLVNAYDDTCPTDIEHLLSILSYRTGKAA